MSQERSAPGTRATVALQGGGRLAGVSRVLKVKLEAKEIAWQPAGDDVLDVRGEIHSYVYFVRTGSRVVEGEGFSIPFAREVEAPGLDPNRVRVEVEELLSDYDFDPATAEFRHRITVVLNVEPAPAVVDEDQRSGDHAGMAESIVHLPAAASLPVPGSAASGEIRFSQVRTGPSTDDLPEGQAREAPPPSPPAAPKHDGEKDILVWKPFPPPIES